MDVTRTSDNDGDDNSHLSTEETIPEMPAECFLDIDLQPEIGTPSTSTGASPFYTAVSFEQQSVEIQSSRSSNDVEDVVRIDESPGEFLKFYIYSTLLVNGTPLR